MMLPCCRACVPMCMTMSRYASTVRTRYVLSSTICRIRTIFGTSILQYTDLYTCCRRGSHVAECGGKKGCMGSGMHWDRHVGCRCIYTCADIYANIHVNVHVHVHIFVLAAHSHDFACTRLHPHVDLGLRPRYVPSQILATRLFPNHPCPRTYTLCTECIRFVARSAKRWMCEEVGRGEGTRRMVLACIDAIHVHVDAPCPYTHACFQDSDAWDASVGKKMWSSPRGKKAIGVINRACQVDLETVWKTSGENFGTRHVHSMCMTCA